MQLIVAACGLLCNYCPAYIGTQTNDLALIEKTAREWSVQFGVEIKPEDVWCTGCMTEGDRKCTHCASGCEIRRCVQQRGLMGFGCATCVDRPDCDKLQHIAGHVPPTTQLLDSLAAFKNHFCPEK